MSPEHVQVMDGPRAQSDRNPHVSLIRAGCGQSAGSRPSRQPGAEPAYDLLHRHRHRDGGRIRQQLVGRFCLNAARMDPVEALRYQ